MYARAVMLVVGVALSGFVPITVPRTAVAIPSSSECYEVYAAKPTMAERTTNARHSGE